MSNQIGVIKATAFAMLLMFGSVGCGKLEFTQNPLEDIKIPKILKPSAQGVEIVSGAAVGQRTVLNGYYVDTSVGAMRDKLESTTPNGYTIYHGVKGSIVSDETASQ